MKGIEDERRGIEHKSDDADDYDLKCELMEKRIYFYLS